MLPYFRISCRSVAIFISNVIFSEEFVDVPSPQQFLLRLHVYSFLMSTKTREQNNTRRGGCSLYSGHFKEH